MNILKFGGTSVGTPERMRGIAELIAQGKNQIVVLSAVSGTTNSLLEICTALQQKDKEEAVALVGKLEVMYEKFISDLISQGVRHEEASEMVSAYLNGVKSYANREMTLFVERSILAQGELISSCIFLHYLKRDL